MNIRLLAGVTSLAALVALTGVGCSSSPDPETGDQDSGATHDGAVTHDGGAKDTSTPQVDAQVDSQVDGGVDAEALPDSSVPVDASDDVTAKDGGSDAAITDATSDAVSIVDASDAAIDAAAHDAATVLDATPPSDSSVPDASDPDGSLVCAPADMSGFQPVWHGPVAHSNSCSTAQITAYHQCLMDGQTQVNPASCAPFSGTSATTANKTCLACILTQDTASSYGPIVVHKGTIEINVPGCLALATNDLQGTGCAGKYQAASECRNAACAADCPVTDDASFQLEQQCETAAAAGTCKTEEDAASCADGLVDAGGKAAACLTGQTFDDLYDAIVPVFCGP